MIIRFVYIIFLGLLIATFIGVGIAAFYKEPRSPEPYYAPKVAVPDDSSTESARFQQEENIRQQNEWKLHDEKRRAYNRDVSAITLGFFVVLFVISLVFLNKIYIISDGILLGSLFTLIYSIIRGFESQDETFRFIVVAVGLVIALILGYLKFVKVLPKKA